MSCLLDSDSNTSDIDELIPCEDLSVNYDGVPLLAFRGSGNNHDEQLDAMQPTSAYTQRIHKANDDGSTAFLQLFPE